MFEFNFLLLDWSPYQGLTPILLYYLTIAGGKIVDCILFTTVLVIREMETVLSKA